MFLVDAGHGPWLDEQAGLFLDLAAEPGADRPVEFENPAGYLPFVGVAALHDEDASVGVGDDGGDADGVCAGGGHGGLPSKVHRAMVASSWRL